METNKRKSLLVWGLEYSTHFWFWVVVLYLFSVAAVWFAWSHGPTLFWKVFGSCISAIPGPAIHFQRWQRYRRAVAANDPTTWENSLP